MPTDQQEFSGEERTVAPVGRCLYHLRVAEILDDERSKSAQG